VKRAKPTVKKAVLAYSGGLDTSILPHWLKDNYGCRVVAWCADVGQGEDLHAIGDKALRTGADEFMVTDLRRAFVEHYVFAALRANAIYEGEYLMGTSLARPCMVEGIMAAVAATGADAVVHGATGKGNDQVRFELGALHFDPRVTILAPWREWELTSRSDCMEYARKHDIPVSATVDKPYSIDPNLFHTSYEGGILEDPWKEAPAEIFKMTVAPEQAPDAPAYVTIDFERGVPTAVDGVPLDPVALLTRLNDLGGRHGVGRVDVVEDRYVGMKSRGVYETPGGTVLHKAHRALESITLDREVMRLRDALVPEYAALVYRGFWFSPEREMLQGMIDQTQERVTGTVRLKLFKGGVYVAGRKSPESLYREDYVTFERDEVYDQSDATGFLRISSLRLRLRRLRDLGRGGRAG
jgi:argininosuccinate synthase